MPSASLGNLSRQETGIKSIASKESFRINFLCRSRLQENLIIEQFISIICLLGARVLSPRNKTITKRDKSEFFVIKIYFATTMLLPTESRGSHSEKSLLILMALWAANVSRGIKPSKLLERKHVAETQNRPAITH